MAEVSKEELRPSEPNIKYRKKFSTAPDKVLLMGELGTNEMYEQYYTYIVKQVQEDTGFRIYGNTVISDRDRFEKIGDPGEFELIEASATENVSQVFYFDNEEIPEIDLGIKLSPYILNGANCYIITERRLKAEHPLISLIII